MWFGFRKQGGKQRHRDTETQRHRDTETQRAGLAKKNTASEGALPLPLPLPGMPWGFSLCGFFTVLGTAGALSSLGPHIPTP